MPRFQSHVSEKTVVTETKFLHGKEVQLDSFHSNRSHYMVAFTSCA